MEEVLALFLLSDWPFGYPVYCILAATTEFMGKGFHRKMAHHDKIQTVVQNMAEMYWKFYYSVYQKNETLCFAFCAVMPLTLQ